MTDRTVAIIGGGPAGLAAAIELRGRGVGDVLVIEREREAGGIPRKAFASASSPQEGIATPGAARERVT